MVARRDQFEADGDFVTADIAGEPIVVVRDKAQLRGFFNVCRHHAAQVVEGVSGCVRALHCPYHGWTYNLDGSLRSAPQFEQARDFDRTRHGLVPVRVDSWGEWAFVCLDEDTEPLDVFLQEVSEEFLALNTQALGFHECVSYTLDCNWKVFVDNFLDGGYHVPYLHRELNSTLDARDGGRLRTPLSDLLPGGHTEEDLELARKALEVVQSLAPSESQWNNGPKPLSES